jgi:processive 1,2-diacylglycerol beta-glucosyltransferase
MSIDLHIIRFMKVLILAVPVGSGHIKAARAIHDALKELDPEVTVRFEDCFKWVAPLYGYAYRKVYNFGQKKARKLLKFFYSGTGVSTGSSDLLYKSHKAIAYRFKNLLKEYKPDYILCTHFSPGYFSALYKNDYHYKMGVVVTDYYVHPHWINKEMDHYFIPHEFLTDQVISYGGKKERVFPFGIPVALELEGYIDKEVTRRRFGLSKNRISVVVMGSRVFGGEWFELVRELVDFDYDLLVLCGDNKEAMERIKGLKGKANKSTYGMVERVYELIATTDILITKAGGITTTEATKASPCLLFANSIVGLEDKNEDFLIKHGAALRLTKRNAPKVMADLLAHPEKMDTMKNSLKKLGKRNSAGNIARIILGLYETR